jgi:hypothetical protein
MGNIPTTAYLSSNYATYNYLSTLRFGAQMTPTVYFGGGMNTNYTISFNGLQGNPYFSMNAAGTLFTVLKPFNGQISLGIVLSQYSPGNYNQPMTLTLNKNSSSIYVSSKIATTQGLLYQSRSDTDSNHAIGSQTGYLNTSGDPIQCAGICDNDTRCVGWSGNSNGGSSVCFMNTALTNLNGTSASYSTYSSVVNGSLYTGIIPTTFNTGDTFSVVLSRACTLVSGNIYVAAF